MTFKVIAELTPHESLVVRFYPKERTRVASFEPDVLRRARLAGVRVPTVIADSSTGPESPLAYVVYERIAGVPFSERAAHLTGRQTQAVAGEVAEQIARLAAIPVKGWGSLVTGHAGQYSCWSDFVVPAIQGGLESARALGLIAKDRDLRHLMRLAETNIITEPPGLCWADITLENIIVDSNDRFVALVDFESVLAADASVAVGYAFARCAGTEFLSHLLESSGGTERIESIYFYAVLRGLRLARHAGDPLPTGGTRRAITDVLPGFMPAFDSLQQAAAL